MAIVMKGPDVALAMKEKLIEETERLKSRGILPKLAIIRVGSRGDDLAYERGAKKKMESIGIACEVHELGEEISQEELEKVFAQVNADKGVHGILLFRPLPKHLDETPLKAAISIRKDSDCMGPANTAAVFCGDENAYPPCTAQAVIEMLEHYKIDLQGKKVTIVGRSMVVGKPLSMLMLKKNATVTICHSKTVDLAKTCRDSDILVAAIGRAKMIGADMIPNGGVVVDVGINVDEEGRLCGDVDYDEAEKKAAYISPVPKGVGSITSSVLAKHVLRSAAEMLRDI